MNEISNKVLQQWEAETVRIQKLKYYLNFKIDFRMNSKLKVEQKTCEIWLSGHLCFSFALNYKTIF